MFKKFTIKSDVSAHTQVKSSVARKIIKAIVAQYPMLADEVEQLFPKKGAIFTSKVPGYLGLVTCQDFIWFFTTRDGACVGVSVLRTKCCARARSCLFCRARAPSVLVLFVSDTCMKPRRIGFATTL
jgi:hypothetical protein